MAAMTPWDKDKVMRWLVVWGKKCQAKYGPPPVGTNWVIYAFRCYYGAGPLLTWPTLDNDIVPDRALIVSCGRFLMDDDNQYEIKHKDYTDGVAEQSRAFNDTSVLDADVSQAAGPKADG